MVSFFVRSSFAIVRYESTSITSPKLLAGFLPNLAGIIFVCPYLIYSEKQLKDIKILLTI